MAWFDVLTWSLLGLLVVVALAFSVKAWARMRAQAQVPRASISAFDCYPWPRDYLPLVVTASPEAMMMHRTIQAAVKWWNKRSGLDLFFPVVLDVDQGESHRHRLVHISMSLLQKGLDAPRIAVQFDRVSGETSVKKPVSIPPVADQDTIDRLVMRELGHVLGLESDQEPLSVMNRALGPEASVRDLVISRAHLDQLAAWYE